ncbi:MAG: helix-turn-helix domain-containing protein [Chthoniobacterales bacterium]
MNYYFMENSRPTAPADQLFSGVIQRDAIEDMAGAVRNFFDLEAVQLEPGACRCKIEFIAAGSVFFYREHYPLRTHLTGELLHNRFGFAVPVQGPSLKFSGEEMDRCRLASAMTGEQMEVFAPGGLKQFVVLMDHAQLLSLADTAGLPTEVQRALRPGRPGMPLVSKPRAVAALSQRLQQLLRLAAIGELEADAAYVEDWVYAQALAVLDVKDAPAGRPSAAVLVRRAVEATEAYGGPVRVAHLCRTLRVSPGTLENAFKVVAGVTPHTFFLRRRLSQVREVLLREDPLERRVTEIATEFGFSELGRFSVRYREMFGEKPSETLRRSAVTKVSLAR